MTATRTRPGDSRRTVVMTVGVSAAFVAAFFGAIFFLSRTSNLDPDDLPARAPAGSVAPAVPEGVWVGTVSRIVAGDAFWVVVDDPNGTGLPPGEALRLTLAGVVAPDLESDPPDCLAAPSRRYLADIGRVNTQLFLTAPSGNDDAVDAWLGNGVWVNGEVLGRGYGRLGPQAGRHPYAELREDIEARARADERGVWDPGLCPAG